MTDDNPELAGTKTTDLPTAEMKNPPTGQTNSKSSSGKLLRSGRNIVPRETIAGSSLVFVISIMAFLACITLGAVAMIKGSSDQWQSDISREVTIQIKPADGSNMDEAIRKASRIALSHEGVTRVTALSEDASAKLLEPWLGTGLELNELPVPRLLMVTIAEGLSPDFTSLREQLENEVAGASLDDHRLWVDRLTAMSLTMVTIGMLVFLLVMAATVMTVVFATRGAMSGNRDVVDVLHFVGADSRFISRQFQKHFFLLGLKGAISGGSLAIILFILIGLWASLRDDSADLEQLSALFGSFSPGMVGYAGMVAVVALVSILVSLTSRLTVQNHVQMLQDYNRTA